MVPSSSRSWDDIAGTSKNTELMIKSKRIVYRMRKVLNSAEVDDDFEQVFDTLSMQRDEKRIAIEELLKIRENIRNSLKTSVTNAQPDGFLSHLNPHAFENFRKQALSLLMSSGNGNAQLKIPDDSDKDSRYGEEVVVGRVQVIASSEDFRMSKNPTTQSLRISSHNGRQENVKNLENGNNNHPEPPRPQGIPRLDVEMLRDEEEADRSDDNFSDLKSGDPIPSPFDGFYKKTQNLDVNSARMMADLMSRLDQAEKKNKQLEGEIEREKRKKRVIASRPRPAPQHEVAIQTNRIEEEEPERREIMVQTSDVEQVQTKDVAVDIQSLVDPTEFKKTPRVVEDDSESLHSDMSEGEVRIERTSMKMLSVRSDGQCVFDSNSKPEISNRISELKVKDGEAQTSQRTPRVVEYFEDDEVDITPRPMRFLVKPEDVLILSNRNKAGSSRGSDLRVAERTISNSSIDTSLSPISLESSLNSMQLKVQQSLMSKSAEPVRTAQEALKRDVSSSSLPPIKTKKVASSKMYGNASTSEEEDEEGTASDADDESVSV